MRKHYPWLWFDADGTLFDYDRAERIALEKVFESLDTVFKDEYVEIYRRINKELWLALERHEISPEVLQVRRFELLVEATEVCCSPLHMSMAYVEQLAIRAELIDGAYDVVRALHAKCRVAIVTNGLQEVQYSRLAHSPLKDYVVDLIVSQEVGAAKPKLAFFEAAFTRLDCPAKSDVLIIGDSLTSDMKGGVDYGIDTCWYNPSREPRPVDLPITYEIEHLHGLLDVLG
jgi:2-haloacid dehalogenase